MFLRSTLQSAIELTALLLRMCVCVSVCVRVRVCAEECVARGAGGQGAGGPPVGVAMGAYAHPPDGHGAGDVDPDLPEPGQGAETTRLETERNTTAVDNEPILMSAHTSLCRRVSPEYRYTELFKLFHPPPTMHCEGPDQGGVDLKDRAACVLLKQRNA